MQAEGVFGIYYNLRVKDSEIGYRDVLADDEKIQLQDGIYRITLYRLIETFPSHA
jgi:hypothetical protein